MKTNSLLHTPEGVRDIYGDELQRKLSLEEKLRETIRSFGYNDIETPSFEYFDIYSKEIGTTPSKEIYKFFGSENNTLALRPDFTPGVVRSAVKYFMEDELPIKLVYLGNTFSNRSDLQGKLKEITELGVEHLGNASADADAEMIYMAVCLLRTAGLKDFQICLGTEEYFRGLCEAAGLENEDRADLSEHIRNKNYFGTMDFIESLDIKDNVKNALAAFSDFAGDVEILDSAYELAKGIKRSEAAIERLKNVYDLLKIYGVENYVSFDLGMLSKREYYTGIVFRAYTFGTGDAIIRGGRYDNLLVKFGKDVAATGFTVVIDELMNTLSAQHIDISLDLKRAIVAYDEKSLAEALRLCEELRADGVDTEMLSIAFSEEKLKMRAKNLGNAKLYFVIDGERKEEEL